MKAAGEVLPPSESLTGPRHRPGARSARRKQAATIIQQTAMKRSLVMWFGSKHRPFASRDNRPAHGPTRTSFRPPTFEPLEGRRLMSAAPSVSIADLTVAEGNGGARNALVTVSLSAASH